MQLGTGRGPISLLCPGFALEGSRIDTLGTSVVDSGPSGAPLNSFARSAQWGGQAGRAKQKGRQGRRDGDYSYHPCLGGSYHSDPQITSKQFEDDQFVADEVPAVNRKCSFICRYRLVKWTLE